MRNTPVGTRDNHHMTMRFKQIENKHIVLYIKLILYIRMGKVNIKIMHIQQPADILSKYVGQELIFILVTDRQPSVQNQQSMVRSWKIQNNYVSQEELKRALRSSFIEHYSISSDIGDGRGNAEVFQDAVEAPQVSRENIQSAREDVNRLLEERRRQEQAIRQQANNNFEHALRTTANLFSRLVSAASCIGRRRAASSMSGIREKKQQPQQQQPQAPIQEPQINIQSRTVKNRINTRSNLEK